ncbi:MAG: M23 family metallopeptidase [Akkermansiaceae bacterium]|nr:M23 family metallopeptidase [Akkermansiaceae bacterium]
MTRMTRMLAAAWLGLFSSGTAVEPADLRLPTENDNLLKGRPADFYMYVDRTFEGVVSKPWEGGTFGFTRTPIRVNGQVVFTRFHEGIDVSPLRRDKNGNPLDPVNSVADGTVVHVSPVSGRSNYGKYLVVAHDWQGSRVFSLYAHMGDICRQPGDQVKAGDRLGTLGYTGVGLNRTRAHLHLELCLMLNPRYQGWHQATGKGINHHGIYNGMNMAGADIAAFYLGRAENPRLSFSEFMAAVPVYFKVAVPDHGGFDFPERYPYLRRDGAAAQPEAARPPAWEISFSATGLPVGFAASQRQVSQPTLLQVRPSDIPHRYLTRNLLAGEGRTPTLGKSGRELVALLTGDFPDPPESAAAHGKLKTES